MQHYPLLKAQAGFRRLQQPQAVISSSSSSSSRPNYRHNYRRKLLIPGQQQRYSRHITRSAGAWNGAGSGSFYSAGNNAAAGAAGSNGSSSDPNGASSQWQTNANNNSGFTPSRGSTWEEEAAGSSGWQDFQNVDWGQTYQTGDWGEPGTVNGSQQQHQQPGQQQFGAMPEDTSSNFSGAYGNSSSSSSPNAFYSDFPHQQQQQSGAADGWPFAESRQRQQQQQPGSSSGGRPPMLPSDITLLGRRDADNMLPLFPSPEQARFYQPRTMPERLVQVLGSFGISVALSKSAVLAGPALLFPIWGPWMRAGVRNVQMYLRQFTCVGLWRSEVLSVKLNTVPYAYRDPTGAMSDTVTVTVGDPWQGGAATELTFPYQAGVEDIVEGEPAELLVLSQDDAFYNFKVVREVYLPQSGMWLSEYPFVDRDVFLDVSLAIECGRQAAAGGGTPTAATAAAGGSMRMGGSMGASPSPAAAAATAQQPFGPAVGYTGAVYPDMAGTGFGAVGGAAGSPYAAGASSPAAAYAAASGGMAASAYGSMPFSQGAWMYPSSNPVAGMYPNPVPGGFGPTYDAAAFAAGPATSNYTVPEQGRPVVPASSSSDNNGSSSANSEAAAAQQPDAGSVNVSSTTSSGWAGAGTDSMQAEQLGTSNGAAAAAAAESAGSADVAGAGYSGFTSTAEPPSSASTSGSGISGQQGYHSSFPGNAADSISSGSGSLFNDPAALAEDVADAATGVVGSVAGAATGVVSSMAGAATDVAADVADAATGVASSVAAGFTGWFSGAPGSSSSAGGSSGSDTAVVPDVIIEGPGMHWAPVGYYGSRAGGYYGGYYGSSGGGGGWTPPPPPPQQQQQPGMGGGFGSVYADTPPGFSGGQQWYEGYAGYSQQGAPAGWSNSSSGTAYGDPGSGGSSSSSSGYGGPQPQQQQPPSGYATTSDCPTGQQQGV